MAAQAVKLVPLLFRQPVQSSGSNSEWRYYEIDISKHGVDRLGPFTKELVVHSNTEEVTSFVEWKVVLWWSTDGLVWSSPVDLITAVSANGQSIHAPFTDGAKLGIHLRMGIACKNSSGTAIESAVVTAAVAFNLYT